MKGRWAMQAVSTVVVGSRSGEWHERFKLVEAMLARGFHYVEDTSRQGYGWWCHVYRGILPVGPSVEKYEGAKVVLDAAAKEEQHEPVS
jgi:hypothetical protein